MLTCDLLEKPWLRKSPEMLSNERKTSALSRSTKTEPELFIFRYLKRSSSVVTRESLSTAGFPEI